MKIHSLFKAWLGDIWHRRVGWKFRGIPKLHIYPGGYEIDWLFLLILIPR